jgi:hypothetical protein
MSYKLQRHAQMADQVGNIWRDGKREEPLSYVYVGKREGENGGEANLYDREYGQTNSLLRERGMDVFVES